MELSVFLAKLIGIYLLIVSTIWFFRKHQVTSSIKELVSSSGTLAISAEISLIFGLVIVIDHSIWEVNWRGLITVLGYLMIMKGIVRYAFPNQVKVLASKMLNSGGVCSVFVALFVIGLYLTYCGFRYSH